MQIEISDKSVDLALIKASGQLGVSHRDLGYKVIAEEKRLWGLLGKTVTIQVWSKASKPNSPRRNNKQSSPRKQETLVIDEAVLNKIRLFCEKLCSLIADEEVKITGTQKGEYYTLSCQNVYIAEKLSKVPKLSESIERIALRVHKDEINNKAFRLFFDAGNVRQGREEDLIKLAKSLANKAIKTRKTVALNSKTAHDRKIVHMTLDNENRVYTKSVGTGMNRKLLIIPVRGKKTRTHD